MGVRVWVHAIAAVQALVGLQNVFCPAGSAYWTAAHSEVPVNAVVACFHERCIQRWVWLSMTSRELKTEPGREADCNCRHNNLLQGSQTAFAMLSASRYGILTASQSSREEIKALGDCSVAPHMATFQVACLLLSCQSHWRSLNLLKKANLGVRLASADQGRSHKGKAPDISLAVMPAEQSPSAAVPDADLPITCISGCCQVSACTSAHSKVISISAQGQSSNNIP